MVGLSTRRDSVQSGAYGGGGRQREKFFSITEVDIVAYGDSKTNANIYQPTLKNLLIGANTYYATITNLAADGRSAADGAAAIDAELASATANPRFILYNLGASDAAAIPAEATWKTNTAYILDALHTKWSGATIYIMRVWRRDYETECDAMVSWAADLMATRSWCQVGPDERVFLEGGDDGATYTSDGIHPNAAGYALTAAQWQSVIGA